MNMEKIIMTTNCDEPPSKISHSQGDCSSPRSIRIHSSRAGSIFHWRKGLGQYNIIFCSDGNKLLCLNKVGVSCFGIVSEIK